MNTKEMNCMGCNMNKEMEYKINEFIIFVIEIFKEKKDMSGKDVHELFEKNGVLKYLHDGYDVLHTQGEDWIINDIEEFLKARKQRIK